MAFKFSPCSPCCILIQFRIGCSLFLPNTTAWFFKGSNVVLQVKTDANGVADISSLAQGDTYTVAVSSPDYGDASGIVTIPFASAPGQTTISVILYLTETSTHYCCGNCPLPKSQDSFQASVSFQNSGWDPTDYVYIPAPWACVNVSYFGFSGFRGAPCPDQRTDASTIRCRDGATYNFTPTRRNNFTSPVTFISEEQLIDQQHYKIYGWVGDCATGHWVFLYEEDVYCYGWVTVACQPGAGLIASYQERYQVVYGDGSLGSIFHASSYAFGDSVVWQACDNRVSIISHDFNPDGPGHSVATLVLNGNGP